MKSDTPAIPQLCSSNYWEWRFRIEDKLISKGLDGYLRENALRDTDARVAEDRKALALIRMHVSVGMLPYLQTVTTAYDAWQH